MARRELTRKRIKGKVYDTATATEIASFDNGRFSVDGEYLQETLMQTPEGAYFLYGVGGMFSKYGRVIKGELSEAQAITALTPSEARQWLEQHNLTSDLLVPSNSDKSGAA